MFSSAILSAHAMPCHKIIYDNPFFVSTSNARRTTMKQGTALEPLKAELSRQAGVREDFLFNTGELKLISGVGSKEPAPLLSTPEALSPAVLSTSAGQFDMMEFALEQLSAHLGVPLRYLRKERTLQGSFCDFRDECFIHCIVARKFSPQIGMNGWRGCVIFSYNNTWRQSISCGGARAF
jgi:hypothetical protein